MSNEQRLIAGCKRGESWARKEVYEKYAPAMLSLCVRYIVDNEAAKDIMQDGFVRLFTKIDQYNGSGAFSAWIRQIFVNTSLDYLAKNKMLRMNVSMDSFPDTLDEFDANAMKRVTADDLIECISELPDKSRAIFNMYAIEGFSHAEIAARIGMQENSVRAIFSRARKIVQQSVLDLMKKQ